MNKNICSIEAVSGITCTVDMVAYIGKGKTYCDMLDVLRTGCFMECKCFFCIFTVMSDSGTEMNSEGEKIYFGSFREGKRDGRGEEFENGKLVIVMVLKDL